MPHTSRLPSWSRAALGSSSNKGHDHARPQDGCYLDIITWVSHSTRHTPDYDSKLTTHVQEAQRYTEKTAVKRVA